MRRHPKASAVGSTLDAASSRARSGRVVATRGAFGDSKGSGAPSRGRLLALALAALALLAFAPIAQAKTVVSGFGTTGTQGGQFGAGQFDTPPRGIAVNNSGNGAAIGTTYVVDSQNRVQRFSPTGVFERTWGQNVLGRDERQTIALSGVSNGTFTLAFGANTTGNIAFKASPEAVQSALAGLASIGSGNVSVSGSNGGPYSVRFIGALGGTDVSQLLPDGSGLSGPSPSIVASTVENGSGGNSTGAEVCTVAANCQDGLASASSANGGDFNKPQGVAVNQTTGHVYVTERGNNRVQEFDADGNFVRAWGWDVDGSNPSTGFEVCTVAANCKSGVSGSGAGQFVGFFNGAIIGYPVIDSSGNVWVPDPENSRIQVFSAAGAFLKMVGGDVISDGAEGTGNLTEGSTAVSALTTTKRLFEPGQTITAPSGIEAGTTIVSCSPSCATATSLTLSKAATATVPAQTLTAAEGAGNVAVNERQTVTLDNATGGTFTLSFNGQQASAAIPFNASASVLREKLEGIPAIGAGNVAVTGSAGGPWVVEFIGKLAGADVPQMTESTGGLTTGSGLLENDIVSSANPGALEACSVAPDCRAVKAAGGTALGQFSARGARIPPKSANVSLGVGGIAFDASGNIYALDDGNRRVQKIDPAISSASQFGAASLAAFTPRAPERLAAVQSGSRIAFVVNTSQEPNTFAGERQIVELDAADGSVKDTSLVGAGFKNGNGEDPYAIFGLASNDTTSTVYATTNSPVSPRKVLALNATPPPAPLVTIADVTTKASTTATLSATVDPKGGLVSCSFQYSTDQLVWTDVKDPDCDSLALSGAQPISENATGLLPATHYFVRLSISRPLVSGSTVNSGVKAFDTDGVAPLVSNVGAVEVSDVSARLVATIDPRNSATGYVFQYGTTPALGSATLAVNIGGGVTPKVVSQLVSGLSPSTTYYFRLVATNLSGTTQSASKMLSTLSEPLPLPDGRAYEQTTPDAVNNVDVGAAGETKMSVARNGQALAICNIYPIGGEAASGDCGNDYVIHRTATGWESKTLVPPYCPIDPATGLSGKLHASWFSANLDHAIFLRPDSATCPEPSIVPGAPMGANNLYRADLLTGTYDLLTPILSGVSNPAQMPLGAALEQSKGGGASDDFGHVFYETTGLQAPGTPAGNFKKLIEWDHGTLRLASVKPDGTAFTNAIRLAEPALGGVSANGNRVFFQNPLPEGIFGIPASVKIYMRENGATTYDISQTECTASCGAASYELFNWATPDGSKVLFESAERLSNEDGDTSASEDLYEYRHSANPTTDQNLTVLTRDNEPSDGTSAEYLSLLGISDDGNTAFFVARGQIVAGRSTASGPKVYRWRWNGGSPKVDYLATLDGSVGTIIEGSCQVGYANDKWFDEQNWRCSALAQDARKDVRLVTPDGQRLMLDTIKPLDPVADSDSDRDAYLWDEAHGWRCISCQRPGVPSSGVSVIKGADGVGGLNNPTQSRFPIVVSSDDGRKLFFTSRDQLVPQDTNGTVRDVYEWNEGTLSLISSGTSKKDNLLVGVSASADDVFFMTVDTLVGWDADNVKDIYDARIGGGFPEPPATGASCEGEACRGPASGAPANTGAGSAAFQGPGNQSSGSVTRCPKGTHKATVKGKKVCKKPSKPKKHKSQKRHQRRASNDRRAGR